MMARRSRACSVDLFLEAHARPPEQIILDLDATDDPIHGHQEGRFFHGYYDGYCYLPLYVFCGRHLLAARLMSLGVEFSLIMGAENSLVGALPGVPGRAPELPAFPSSPTMPADEVSDGGGDGGPAGRIDDDLGPSPPGIIGHGDRTPHGA